MPGSFRVTGSRPGAGEIVSLGNTRWVAEDEEHIGYLPRALGSTWALNALLLISSYWQEPYYLTLVSAFRVQMLVTLWILGLLLLFVLPHRNRWLFIALPLGISLTFSGYFWQRGSPEQLQGPELKLAVANILGRNRDLHGLKQWVQHEQPDVLGILEIRGHHLSALENLGFEYQYFHPLENNFGIGIVAKTQPDQVTLLESDFPSIVASWEAGNGPGPCRVVITHPVPPVSLDAREDGDIQISEILAQYGTGELPLVVLGDLNATGWDLRTAPLLEAGLKDARSGHGLLPTWPVGSPFFWIPIDHILIPQDWWSVDCQTGPDIGSDHFPLSAVVRRP